LDVQLVAGAISVLLFSLLNKSTLQVPHLACLLPNMHAVLLLAAPPSTWTWTAAPPFFHSDAAIAMT
jgi:hypothetical protein